MPANSPSSLPTHPELLAPAGDWEAMRAAVANGADAVYFGLSNFNARFRATNFTLEELPEVMKYLHDHNVRGYVAFNTLVFSDELPEAAKFITACADAGADALIVQDLGLARLIHAMAPSLPIHGSTQMTLTEPRGIEFVGTLGVQRVILARELSANEIEHIAISTTIPVEVFIHGALCVAYSGQCLTSESLGGRSANRGQCAQACRLPYDLIVDGHHKPLGDKAYLLSPQDLAAHDLIDDLVRIGVSSFKIEGRLKSAQYVAAATQTYRSALDAAIAHTPFRIAPQQQQELTQSFSRGFTHGFLDGPNHQELVHARFPKSRGIRVGLVAGKTRDGVTITLDAPGNAPLKPGDGVVFDEGHPEQDEQGGRVVAVKELSGRSPRRIEVLFLPGAVNLAAIAVGSIIWKTHDPAISKRLEQSYARETIARRVALSIEITAIVGQPLEVVMRAPEGRIARVRSDAPMARAEKHPLTVELAREQFGRLGQTPYELADLRLRGKTEADAPEPVMVPKSVLNDLRRRAVDALMTQRSAAASHAIGQPNVLETLRLDITYQKSQIKNQKSEMLAVLVRTTDQLQAVLNWLPPTGQRPSIVYCDFEDIRRYAEAVPLAKSAGLPIALATLRIVKSSEEGLLQKIADYNPDAILVRNLAAVSFYSQHAPQIPLHGDYSLNIANDLTAAIFARAGLRRMTPSYDLNWTQLGALLRQFPAGMFEAVIHQHMPMFHMEHCVFAHTLSNGKDYRDCGRPCDRHQVDLKDRVGQAHPLIPDVGCRNTVFNASAQSAAEYVPRMKEMGLRHFRVELLRESADQATALLDRYARVLAGVEDGKTTWRQLRVLNQLGVTRGTLDYV
jgi:putative protease